MCSKCFLHPLSLCIATKPSSTSLTCSAFYTNALLNRRGTELQSLQARCEYSQTSDSWLAFTLSSLYLSFPLSFSSDTGTPYMKKLNKWQTPVIQLFVIIHSSLKGSQTIMTTAPLDLIYIKLHLEEFTPSNCASSSKRVPSLSMSQRCCWWQRRRIHYLPLHNLQ